MSFLVFLTPNAMPLQCRCNAVAMPLQCRSQTGKHILGDLFSSILSQFEKYHPSGKLKFIKLGISQC